jgi:hypothetical protein
MKEVGCWLLAVFVQVFGNTKYIAFISEMMAAYCPRRTTDDDRKLSNITTREYKQQ